MKAEHGMGDDVVLKQRGGMFAVNQAADGYEMINEPGYRAIGNDYSFADSIDVEDCSLARSHESMLEEHDDVEVKQIQNHATLHPGSLSTRAHGLFQMPTISPLVFVSKDAK